MSIIGNNGLLFNIRSIGDQGLYTEEQLDDMIYNDGYIPVASASELNNIRNAITAWMGAGTKYYNTYEIGAVSHKYVQVKHINLNSISFSPIGEETSAGYTLEYDGNDLSISNLNVSASMQGCGLFSYIFTVKNMRVSGTVVNSTSYQNTGGIAGHALIMSNCRFSGSVTGGDNTGGLVGFVNDSPITKSYSTGSVTGTNEVGGLVGGLNNSILSNCWSSASVTCSGNFSGGLIGRAYTDVVSNSFSLGSVSGSSYSGGLCGLNTGTFTDCYWDTITSGKSTSDGGMGKTTTQLKADAIGSGIYLNWSVSIWAKTTGYPYLIDNN